MLQVRELATAADQRAERLGRSGKRNRHGRVGTGPVAPHERRVLAQDRAFEIAQLRARVEAELVEQDRPHPLVRLQRVALASLAVQRQHQLGPEPLAQRVRRDLLFERRDELAARAHRELDLVALLDRVELLVVQP